MAKKLKFVKLDTLGIAKFQKTLGQNGQTFKAGLFDSENATKGYLLEVGDETHNKVVMRPWLSQLGKSPRVSGIIAVELGLFASHAFQGKDRKGRTAENIEHAIKDFLYLQEFDAPALTDYTVKLKNARNAVNARGIGLDSLKMLKAIKVKPVGGKRKPNKKK
jgi:hypothetical protein